MLPEEDPFKAMVKPSVCWMLICRYTGPTGGILLREDDSLAQEHKGKNAANNNKRFFITLSSFTKRIVTFSFDHTFLKQY
jgi:hypothetical protein